MSASPVTPRSSGSALRLEPVDRPPTLQARLAAFMMRRELGKVMMPARILYNRVPSWYRVAYALVGFLQKGLELDASTRLLVQTWVAMRNDCGFCIDIAKAQAVQSGLGLEKFLALPDWRSDPLFDARERAALAYVEEANDTRRVSDDTFAAAREHFDERGIVELTILCAVENLFNYMNLPMGIENDGLCAIAQGRAA